VKIVDAVIIQVGKLRRSSWGLPDSSYYKNSENDQSVLSYKKYMATVANLFNVTGNKTDEFVRNTYSIEKRLAQV
jgi:predicted metalloendopeptidase